MNLEKKTGSIEKIGNEGEKDFYFVEKELKGVKFEKLKEGQIVSFEPNISEKGSYANKIEVYVSNEKNFVKKFDIIKNIKIKNKNFNKLFKEISILKKYTNNITKTNKRNVLIIVIFLCICIVSFLIVK